jgi:hypothetical protein
MVANRDRHRGIIALDQDVDRMAFTVLDRIDQQVSEDSFDPPSVDLGFRLTALVHVDLGVVRFGELCVGLH